ncbi:MAG: hypothetical protein AB1641_10740 [Thermodesulfobacteriota bacterium]
MRCHYLAQALLRAWNPDIFFVMGDCSAGVTQARSWGYEVVPSRRGALNELAGQSGALVFDLPGEDGLKEFTQAGRPDLWTIVLDDVGRPFPWADVIVNSGILARPDPYPPGARLLLGPEYLILPESYDPVSWDRSTRRDSPTVMITFGGSDPTGLTLKVIRAISKRKWPGVSFKVILGPGFGPGRDVRDLVDKTTADIEVIENPPELLPWFLQADLVFCAGGRTLYELHALGVPVLAIASIGHEVEGVRAFKDRGLIEAGLEQWNEEVFLREWSYMLKKRQPSLEKRTG